MQLSQDIRFCSLTSSGGGGRRRGGLLSVPRTGTLRASGPHFKLDPGLTSNWKPICNGFRIPCEWRPPLLSPGEQRLVCSWVGGCGYWSVCPAPRFTAFVVTAYKSQRLAVSCDDRTQHISGKISSHQTNQQNEDRFLPNIPCATV